MLPDLYALFFAGEAPQQTEELRKRYLGQTQLIHEEGLPIIPGSLALDPQIAWYQKKVCGTALLVAHMILNINRICRRSPERDLAEFHGKKAIDL
jgi:hypothetical protein